MINKRSRIHGWRFDDVEPRSKEAQNLNIVNLSRRAKAEEEENEDHQEHAKCSIPVEFEDRATIHSFSHPFRGGTLYTHS